MRCQKWRYYLNGANFAQQSREDKSQSTALSLRQNCDMINIFVFCTEKILWDYSRTCNLGSDVQWSL